MRPPLSLASRDNSSAAILDRLRTTSTSIPPPAFPLGVDIERGVVAGLGAGNGCPHFHILGASGVGKSYGIELLVCRLLALRRLVPDRAPGFLLIDPNATLYQRVLRRLAEFHVPPSEVILIELDAGSMFPAFQPLARCGSSLAYQTGSVMRACIKVSRQENFDATRLMRRAMKNVIWPCIEAGCAPSEFEAMLSLADEEPLREAILAQCTNPAVLRAWRQEFAGLHTINQRLERFLGSTINRLESYYEHPFMRRLFGQTDPKKVIDWRAAMDQGKTILVKLYGGDQLSAEDVDMIGVLLLNEIVRAAKKPPLRTQARAFYIICDEFQRLVNRDFLELLNETRKFKIRAWLAHQSPAGLKEKDPELYWSVLTNCRGKVIFGGVSCDELEPLIRDAYAAVFNPDLVKFDLQRTLFCPREETREVVSTMHATAHSHGTTTSWGEMATDATSDSSALQMDGLLLPMATGMGTATSAMSHGSGSSWGGAEVYSESQTEAEGKAVVPFYKLEEKQELSSRQFRDLNEQLHMAVNKAHSLANQHSLIVDPGRPPCVLRVHDLPEPRVSDAEVDAYHQAVEALAGCYDTAAGVDRQIVERQQQLLEAASKPSPLAAPALPERNGTVHANGQVKSLHNRRVHPPAAEADLPSADPVATLRERIKRLDSADTVARDELLRHVGLLSLQARTPLIEQLSLKLKMTKTGVRAALKEVQAKPASKGKARLRPASAKASTYVEASADKSAGKQGSGARREGRS